MIKYICELHECEHTQIKGSKINTTFSKDVPTTGIQITGIYTIFNRHEPYVLMSREVTRQSNIPTKD
jgi:hypothetical protein